MFVWKGLKRRTLCVTHIRACFGSQHTHPDVTLNLGARLVQSCLLKLLYLLRELRVAQSWGVSYLASGPCPGPPQSPCGAGTLIGQRWKPMVSLIKYGAAKQRNKKARLEEVSRCDLFRLQSCHSPPLPTLHYKESQTFSLRVWQSASRAGEWLVPAPQSPAV